MFRPTISVASLALVAHALFSSDADLGAQAPDSVTHSAWDVPWDGRPRDPYVAPAGDRVWFVGQAGNYVAYFTPSSGQFKRVEIDAGTNPHTVVVDKQGSAWYAGNRNGMIGRIDGKTIAIKRFVMPTEAARDPHTIEFDASGNLWFSEREPATRACDPTDSLISIPGASVSSDLPTLVKIGQMLCDTWFTIPRHAASGMNSDQAAEDMRGRTA